MSKFAKQPTEMQLAVIDLRDMFASLPTVNGRKRIFATVTHVSSSGMSRDFKFFLVKDNDIRHINYLIATVGELRQSKHGVRIAGGGMDMGFAILCNVFAELGVKDWQSSFSLDYI